MKTRTNYLKYLLQGGVIILLVGSILWANFNNKPVDIEAYCPFGGLQAIGTYLINNSLACSMSMLQIIMGLALIVCVILFSKLFCGYLCPLGTVSEWIGKGGRKLHLQFEIRSGGILDKLLRAVKYALLFTILYFTFTSSELFCKRLDPYYALATGFKGEIVGWMVSTSLLLLFLGSFVVKQFWCRFICPLGAASNIFKFVLIFLPALFICLMLSHLGFTSAWIWALATTCTLSYIVEIVKMRSCFLPIMTITRDEATCNHCGLCEKACPYTIPLEDFTKIRHVDCTLCGDCICSCHKGALQVNGRRSLRWLPGLLVVVLFFAACWCGNQWELPTINEKWGSTEQLAQTRSYKMEGLLSIKCFGSSKAFSAKMQNVTGVYGVKTFVKSHAVEIIYDPAETDTMKIQAAIFTPTAQQFQAPDAGISALNVIHLGVEGIHDRMDMIHFSTLLKKINGIYGFVAEFACPVKITLYVDPAVTLTESQLKTAIEIQELTLSTKKRTKVIPLHFVLKSYAVEEALPIEKYRAIFQNE
ncbi:MAG: 4Fe-4S binding protein [Alistipes sp.]